MATKTTPEQEEEIVGQRIAQLRKMRGLTQVELAERLGLVQPNLSAYERGVYLPGAALIVRIAKVLKVSTDEVLGVAKPNDDVPLLARKLAKRMRRIETLTRRDQQALIRTIDAFLKNAC